MSAHHLHAATRKIATSTSLCSIAGDWPLLLRRHDHHCRSGGGARDRAARALASAASAASPRPRARSSTTNTTTRPSATPSANQAAGGAAAAAAMPPLSAPAGAAADDRSAAAAAPPASAAVATVFTTRACPYCRSAKALLQSRSIPYREVDVELAAAARGGGAAAQQAQAEAARALRAALAAASGGCRTVPRVFLGSAHVGGSDDLAAADLAALMASPAAREPLPAALAAAVAAAEEAVAAAAAAAGSASPESQQQQQQQAPLTLADRAEPGVRAAYLALLEATSDPSSAAARGPALAALAAARARRGGEASKAAQAQASAASLALFAGEDEGEQRAADAVYAAARADPEADASGGGGGDLEASFAGAELVAALAELQLPAAAAAASGSPSPTPPPQPPLALARALVLANLVNVAGAARRPDPTDSPACRRFFDVTPAKRLRLLSDTLALARGAAEDEAAGGGGARRRAGGGAATTASSPPASSSPAAWLLRLALGDAGKPAPPNYARARPLNAPFWWAGGARPAAAVAEDVRARVVRLYDRHLRLASDGKTVVSYGALRRDPGFWDEYVCAAAELQAVSGLERLPRDALAALAINLYNALVVHGLAAYGPARALGTASGRLAFFRRGARYLIGGGGSSMSKKGGRGGAGQKASSGGDGDANSGGVRWGGLIYTCDDLEHGVLRGNRPGAAAPTMLLGLGLLGASRFAPFQQGDPRLKAIVPPPVDARLHFALVCGAQSCPPIRTYSAATLDEGLGAAAEAFCAASVRVEEEEKVAPGKMRKVTVRMSKIFGWYYPDFGPTKSERLRWLLPHLLGGVGGTRERLAAVLRRDPAARSVRVVYDPYDWTANAAED